MNRQCTANGADRAARRRLRHSSFAIRDFDPAGLLLLTVLLLAFRPCPLHAQNYSIGSFKITTGGGPSAGGPYSLNGTVTPNPAAGPMTGGQYALTGAIKNLIAAVPTPGAPTLYISRAGNAVTLAWQSAPGWVLEQTTNLARPANWSASSGVIMSNGTERLEFPSPAGTLFFRLHQP